MSYLKHWTLVLGVASSALTIPPLAAPAVAQSWRGGDVCRSLAGRDRARCERTADRRDSRRDDRRDRERNRRKDAKTDGIVAGVIGTAILGGIIAAATSGNKKKGDDSRRGYCENRYGNYDESTDQYRASDGRWYPCT